MDTSGSAFDLPRFIDHTILRPATQQAEVLRVCDEANAQGFEVVFVPPCFMKEALARVQGTQIRVGIPIGFPLGSDTTGVKVRAAVEAFQLGVTELDMVMNIGRLKSCDYRAVLDDIRQVVSATPGAGHKVILETCLLTQEEKRIACDLALEGGAQFVKTSTGFESGGATIEDVRFLKRMVGGRGQVKASGGIRDLRMTLALLEAGADRIGTSAGMAIMEEWKRSGKDG